MHKINKNKIVSSSPTLASERVNISEINQEEKISMNYRTKTDLSKINQINASKVYISPDGCCTRFDVYYFTLYLFQAINDSIFKLMMPIESSILLKYHVSCNFMLNITSQFHSDNLRKL